jgi:hypothetical protein
LFSLKLSFSLRALRLCERELPQVSHRQGFTFFIETLPDFFPVPIAYLKGEWQQSDNALIEIRDHPGILAFPAGHVNAVILV